MEIFLFIFGCVGAFFSGLFFIKLNRHMRQSKYLKSAGSLLMGCLTITISICLTFGGLGLILHQLGDKNISNPIPIAVASILIVTAIFLATLKQKWNEYFEIS